MKNVANNICFCIATKERDTCRSITNFFFHFSQNSRFRCFSRFQVSAKQTPMSGIPDIRNSVPQLAKKLAVSVQNRDRNVNFSHQERRRKRGEVGVIGGGSP